MTPSRRPPGNVQRALALSGFLWLAVPLTRVTATADRDDGESGQHNAPADAASSVRKIAVIRGDAASSHPRPLALEAHTRRRGGGRELSEEGSPAAARWNRPTLWRRVGFRRLERPPADHRFQLNRAAMSHVLFSLLRGRLDTGCIVIARVPPGLGSSGGNDEEFSNLAVQDAADGVEGGEPDGSASGTEGERPGEDGDTGGEEQDTPSTHRGLGIHCWLPQVIDVRQCDDDR